VTKAKRLVSVGRVVRFVLALGMIGYLTWDWWQRRNQRSADIWSAGTDPID